MHDIIIKVFHTDPSSDDSFVLCDILYYIHFSRHIIISILLLTTIIINYYSSSSFGFFSYSSPPLLLLSFLRDIGVAELDERPPPWHNLCHSFLYWHCIASWKSDEI